MSLLDASHPSVPVKARVVRPLSQVKAARLVKGETPVIGRVYVPAVKSTCKVQAVALHAFELLALLMACDHVLDVSGRRTQSYPAESDKRTLLRLRRRFHRALELGRTLRRAAV